MADGSIRMMMEDEGRDNIRRDVEDLSFKIAGKLSTLLGQEPYTYQMELMSRLEDALEDSGISVAMANMKPQEYCRQLFWHFQGYLFPLLERCVQLRVEFDQETAEGLIDQLIALLPSQGHGE